MPPALPPLQANVHFQQQVAQPEQAADYNPEQPRVEGQSESLAFE